VNRFEQALDGAIQAIHKMFQYRKTVANCVDGRSTPRRSNLGYLMDDNQPVALMNPLYGDMKSKKKQRLRHLKNLVNLLDRDSQTKEAVPPIAIDYAKFIVENLVYLDYGSLEEIFTVIHTIDGIMATTGVTLRQCIESGWTSEPVTILARRATVFSLMLGLKQHLKSAYGLTEAKCRAFDPRKTTNAKDSKASRTRPLGLIDWSGIPYITGTPHDGGQIQEQLQAVCSRCPSAHVSSLSWRRGRKLPAHKTFSLTRTLKPEKTMIPLL
jgi:Sister chromatid cohesion C-terminus